MNCQYCGMPEDNVPDTWLCESTGSYRSIACHEIAGLKKDNDVLWARLAEKGLCVEDLTDKLNEKIETVHALKERVRVLEGMLPDVRRMCEIAIGNILIGNKELKCIAFNVGHHPDVLKALGGGKEMVE